MRVFYVFVFCVLYSVLAFRGIYVGVDTKNYYFLFDLLKYESFSDDFGLEFLFVFVVKVLDRMNLPPSSLIMVLSFFSLFPLLYWIKKRSWDLMFSLAIFLSMGFYLSMFNISRQMVAVSLLCLAFSFYYNKKYMISATLLFVAFGFHYSALPIFVLSVVLFLNINSIFFLIFWLASLFFLYAPSLLYGLLTIIIDSVLGGAYSQYLQSGVGDNVAGVRVYFLQIIFLFILYFYRYKKIDAYETFVLRCFLFSVILGNLTLGLGYFYRLVVYFEVYMVLALPIFIVGTFDKVSRMVVVWGGAFLLFFFLARNLLNNSGGVVPHDFVF